jgi:hypothetical protein
MALLMAPTILQTSPRAHAWNFAAAVILTLVFVVAVLNIDRFASDELPVELFLAMRPWFGLTLVALLAGTTLALHWRRQAPDLRPVLATALSGFIAWQGVALGYDELSPATSSYHLVRRIAATEGPFRPELPFFAVQTYDQTMTFYLNRTMTLVDFYDEMSLGLDQEPDKGIQTLVEFGDRWNALDAAYATMRPEEYDKLAAAGLPMRVLGRDTRRVVVSRR